VRADDTAARSQERRLFLNSLRNLKLFRITATVSSIGWPGEHFGSFTEAINKSLKNQPMTTLAMAAGMGLVLGALWNR
jgi:hypothetical protein